MNAQKVYSALFLGAAFFIQLAAVHAQEVFQLERDFGIESSGNVIFERIYDNPKVDACLLTGQHLFTLKKVLNPKSKQEEFKMTGLNLSFSDDGQSVDVLDSDTSKRCALNYLSVEDVNGDGVGEMILIDTLRNQIVLVEYLGKGVFGNKQILYNGIGNRRIGASGDGCLYVMKEWQVEEIVDFRNLPELKSYKVKAPKDCDFIRQFTFDEDQNLYGAVVAPEGYIDFALAKKMKPSFSEKVPSGAAPLVVDLNQDGEVDVITSSREEIYWLKNSGGFHFSDKKSIIDINELRNLVANPDDEYLEDWTMFPCDLNGDSLVDCIAHGEHFIALINDGNEGFDVKMMGQGPFDPGISLLCDVNHDGQMELIVNSYGGIFVVRYENGNYQSKERIGKFYWDEIQMLDVDKDGWDDLLLLDDRKVLYWARNQEGVFTEAILYE